MRKCCFACLRCVRSQKCESFFVAHWRSEFPTSEAIVSSCFQNTYCRLIFSHLERTLGCRVEGREGAGPPHIFKAHQIVVPCGITQERADYFIQNIKQYQLSVGNMVVPR